jgi:hydrogenase expression/formation protein HypC
MCLAIPGRVAETWRENEVLMGKVEFSGVTRRVCLDHVPDVKIDEYVLVHVGFALSKIDAAEAAQVFEILRELKQLSELESRPHEIPRRIPERGRREGARGGHRGAATRLGPDGSLRRPDPLDREVRDRPHAPRA